jgi:proprotein convertase subtilisin/kexin type 5
MKCKCLTCIQDGNATNHGCDQCAAGLYKLMDNTINNCYSISEIPQYYLNTTYSVISKCYEKCLSCSQSGDNIKNNCIKCLNGLYPLELNMSQCYSTTDIPQGYYLDSTSGVFIKCYGSCLTCNARGDSAKQNCLNCLDYYYPLEDDTSQCFPFTEVINGYFFNVITSNFTRCYLSCGACKMLGDINQHICSTCKNNYFSLESDNSMCYTKDDSVLGYYLDFNSNVFRKCYKSCIKCTGPGDIINPNCIECDPSYPSCSGCTKKIYKDNCFDDCPILTTYNPLTQMCSNCKPGEYVFNNQCVSTCPDGYAHSYTCVTCLDKKMYNYKNYCVLSCPDGSKLNVNTNICEILCDFGY